MKRVFTERALLRRLRPWFIVCGLGLAAALVAALLAWQFAERSRKEELAVAIRLKTAQTALSAAKTPLLNAKAAQTTVQALNARDFARPEDRLLLVERLNEARERLYLYSLNYTLAPQRAVALSGEPEALRFIEANISPLKITAQALDERPLLALLTELPSLVPGVSSFNHCTIKKTADPSDPTSSPLVLTCSLDWASVKLVR